MNFNIKFNKKGLLEFFVTLVLGTILTALFLAASCQFVGISFLFMIVAGHFIVIAYLCELAEWLSKMIVDKIFKGD